MKKLALIFGFSILGLACSTGPDDVGREQESTSDQGEDVEVSVAGSDEVKTQATCRTVTVGCCTGLKVARRAYQCFGAGTWHTISTRCEQGWPCAY